MIIISDLLKEENEKFIEDIEKYKVYSPDNTEIKKCLGCFNCWIKTPGCCIISDLSNEINKETINSTNLVLITNITYGGYSPFVKNIIERMIPNILPYFKVKNNETHHAARYEKYPNITVIGYGDSLLAEEKVLFNHLVKANSINMQNPSYKSIIVTDKKEISNIVNNIGGN